MKITKSKLVKIIREEIQLMEFREDPNRGLGRDYKAFMKDAKKLPRSKVKKAAAKILNHPKYKNLTPDEAEEFARLINIPYHSTFTQHDLTAYFLKLNKSRG